MKTKNSDSERIYINLPHELAQYFRKGRNPWLQSNPEKGVLYLLEQEGIFNDLDSEALKRRYLSQELGIRRLRAFYYKTAYEHGRRDAARNYLLFDRQESLAVKAGPLFQQIQGKYLINAHNYTFNPKARQVIQELQIEHSMEARSHIAALGHSEIPVCWATAGYLSGYLGEILGRRIITIETICVARGDRYCHFISKFEHEAGEEANWIRESFTQSPLVEILDEKKKEISTLTQRVIQAEKIVNQIKHQREAILFFDEIIAKSPPMRTLIHQAKNIAKGDIPCLIHGPSGSGKETIALAMHKESSKRNGPFEVLCCKGVSPETQMHQLLGYKIKPKNIPTTPASSEGLLYRCQGGTLYIDEITALTPEAQSVLLRAWEKRYEEEKSNTLLIRIFAGTTYSVQNLLDSGKILDDFYYFITSATLSIPPLYERRDDIPHLLHYFLKKFSLRYDKKDIMFSHDCLRALENCSWPGNIRQLRNTVERAVLLSPDKSIIDLSYIPEEVLGQQRGEKHTLLSKENIEAALRQAHGKKTQAAHLLGISRSTLWRLIKRYDIE